MPYAQKPWLNSYDDNVPASLEPYPTNTVHDYLDRSAAQNPDAPASIMSAKLPLFGRKTAMMTYGELSDQSDRMAGALAAMGIKKGDRVAIVMPNCTQFVITFFAILKAGAIVVANNPTYPPARMQYQLKDSGAVAVVALTSYYKMLKSIQADTDVEKIIVTNIKEYFPALGRLFFTLAREKKAGHRLAAVDDGDYWFQDLLEHHTANDRPQIEFDASKDVAIFQYTGGTTGVSKGARSTHKALVVNSAQSISWQGEAEIQGHEEVNLAAIPLFHVYGMVSVVCRAVSRGASMIMVPNARDVDELLSVINDLKPTVFMGVPALYNNLSTHPDVVSGSAQIDSIQLCISGSSPLAPATKQRFEQLTGATLVEAYGMSEMPTGTHVNPLNGINKTGSVGLPLPDVECRIVSLEDGVTDMPVGEVGEIVIRGPHLMLGYHNMPEETANVLREGWLYTGDIGRMDEDGYFYIVDRKKNMALIGGFNVYPNNVEQVLMNHPAVADLGVAAIPHPEKTGEEALKAWLIVAEGYQLDVEALIEFQKDYLAPHEIVRRFEVVDELPRTIIGKVLHRKLVERELAQQNTA